MAKNDQWNPPIEPVDFTNHATSKIRRRWDAPPEDTARTLERERKRFCERIMVNLSSWQIAKVLKPVVSEYGGEGLRGLYLPDEGPEGQLIWWIAYHASHQHGRIMLGKGHDTKVLEVEINITDDGALYPCWQRFSDDPDLEEKFISHPSLKGQIDGLLGSRGKIIQIQNKKIRFVEPENRLPEYAQEMYAQRYELWKNLLDLCPIWVKQRQARIKDTGIPSMDAIRPFRIYVQHQLDWNSSKAVPKLTVDLDGAIILTWRTTGSIATMRFAEGCFSARFNQNGKITNYPTQKVTPACRYDDLYINMALLSFKSAEDDL